MLDLRGPLVDAERPHGPIQAVHRALGQDAASAEDLHRLVHDPLRGLRRERLGHRGLQGDPLGAAVLLPRRPVGEQPGGREVDRHPAELFLDQLKLGQLLAELLPPSRVVQRFIEGPRRHAAGRGRDRRTQTVQRHHPELEALTRLADQMIGGKRTLIEGDLPERMRLAHDLGADEAESISIRRDEKTRDPASTGIGVGGGEHRVDIREAGVGDESLLSVENPGVAPLHRPGLERGHIAPGLRLRHGERSDRTALQHAGQPLPGRRAGAGARQQKRRPAQSLEGEDRIGQR